MSAAETLPRQRKRALQRAGMSAARLKILTSLSDRERLALKGLTDEQLVRFFELREEQEREESGKHQFAYSFHDFIDFVTRGRFQWYEYASRLVEVLQRVVDGELRRVIVQAPPRHGKSEAVTRLMPAYDLYRHPRNFCAIVSYGASLAQTLSRAARANYYFAEGVQGEATAVQQWETAQGGGVWAAGAGGSLLGRGYNIGIIDDPYKNADDAASANLRDKIRDWYSTTFYTRAEPGAAIVIVMQRWAEDDLVGWLFEQEREAAKAVVRGEEDTAEHWYVMEFSALKEPEDAGQNAKDAAAVEALLASLAMDPVARQARTDAHTIDALIDASRYPPTCTLAPDWRAEGEALCEPRYSAKHLRKLRARLGDYFFNALFQQRPHSRTGGLFTLGMLSSRPLAQVPLAGATFVRWWDFASTEETVSSADPDWTVGALLAKLFDGRVVLLDLVRGRWDPGTRDMMIKNTAISDAKTWGRANFETWGEEEGGSAGKTAAAAFIRLLIGHRAYTQRTTGNKVTNAAGLASFASGGQFFMVEASWNGAARREFLDFPREGTGIHDDIVDACSHAFNRLAKGRRKLAPAASGAFQIG